MKERMRPITAHDVSLVTSKFFSYLDDDQDFVELLQVLIRDYTVCLVGGSIRDIVNQIAPRDFDLIVDIDNEALRSHFSKYISQLNSFGGLKCIIQNYTIDIWSFNDNWAFSTGLLPKNVENIPRGAFYNIDALTLDLSNQRMYFELYNHCIDTGVLDFVSHDPHYLKSNPVPAHNVLKSYHVSTKYDLDLSEEVHSYIEEWKTSNVNYINDIIKAEIKHFGCEVYEYQELAQFLMNNIHENHKCFLESECISPRRKSRSIRNRVNAYKRRKG